MAKKSAKQTYNEMIQESLMILDNKTGATRQDIWKCTQKRHDNLDIKQFNKKLVLITKEDKLAHFKVQKMPKNRARFRLDVDFAKRVRLLQAKSSNQELNMTALFNLAAKTDINKAQKKQEKAPAKQEKPKQNAPEQKNTKIVGKKKEPVAPKKAAKKGRKAKESSDLPSQKITTPRQMKNAQKKRENVSPVVIPKQNIAKNKTNAQQGTAKSQKANTKGPIQNIKVGNTKQEINKGSAKKSVPKSKKSKAIKKK